MIKSIFDAQSAAIKRHFAKSLTKECGMLVESKQTQKNLSKNKLSIYFAIVAIGLSFYSSPSFAKAPLCSKILASLETKAIESFKATQVSSKTSKAFIKSTANEIKSTTGNRAELKFTVNLVDLQTALGKFEIRLEKWIPGFKLTSRDTQTPGYKNVTYTKYLTKLKIDYKGQELTTKIRLRKYGLIEENSVIDKNIFQPIDAMKDPHGKEFSWLEFKIEHPDFDNAVLKPRIKFHDQFSDLMSKNPSMFLLNFETIVQKTKELNPENQETVENMLAALKLTIQEKIPLNTISETIYYRTSYVVNLQSQNSSRVNIQLTIDADIHQYSSVLGKEVQTYDPNSNLSVIEVKIPVQYSALNKSDLQEVQGLSEIQLMLKELTEVQSKDYEINKGKFSRAVRVLLQEKERGSNGL